MAQEESDDIEKENSPLISNTEKSLFHPGQTVVLRIIWQGRILEARPEIVVRDTPELLAFYMPPGVNWVRPRTKEGKRISPQNRARLDYLLTEDKLVNFHRLRLAIPDADYSVLIFWNASDMQQRDWYINLEETLHRTEIGFDYTDHFLDVIVRSDLSGWCWKDEDELAEAVDLGLISEDRAAALYREGEKAAGWIQSGKSPFNGWEKWRPDPAWKVPVLPEGWDNI